MKSSLSKLAVLGTIILGFLGTTVLGLKKKDKNKEKTRKEDNNTKSNDVQRISENKTETAKEVSPAVATNERKQVALRRTIKTYNDVDDLLVDVLREVLKEAEFSNSTEFMGNFIQKSVVLCDNNNWYDYFPKNIEEMEDLLKKYNLFNEYNAIIFNKLKN